jgi:hypothetical protein
VSKKWLTWLILSQNYFQCSLAGAWVGGAAAWEELSSKLGHMAWLGQGPGSICVVYRPALAAYSYHTRGPIKKKLVYHPSHPKKVRRRAVFIFIFSIFFIFFTQGFAVQCGYLTYI